MITCLWKIVMEKENFKYISERYLADYSNLTMPDNCVFVLGRLRIHLSAGYNVKCCMWNKIYNKYGMWNVACRMGMLILHVKEHV